MCVYVKSLGKNRGTKNRLVVVHISYAVIDSERKEKITYKNTMLKQFTESAETTKLEKQIQKNWPQAYLGLLSYHTGWLIKTPPNLQ